MTENAYIDDNSRNTLTAIASDGSGEIYNLRSNPITKALLVEADVLSTNTDIGSTILGGTEGSILFIGPGSTLSQDNDNLFWDDTNNFLGLGTMALPLATLHVDGSLKFDLGGDQTGDMYFRNSSGFIEALPIGSDGEILVVSSGIPSWSTTGGSTGYNLFQNEGVSVTQRTTVNLSNLLTASDVGGKTALTINVTNLANNSTFLSNLNLNDISGQIDLTTQVSGVLPVPNGGTGASSLTGILKGNGTSAVSAVTISQGDLFYGSASNVLTALPKDTSSTRYLSNQGTGNNPSWNQVNLTNGVTGLLPAANIDISNLESNLDLANISGQIDLTTQVTGVLPLANGGTGSNLSDPGANKIVGWDDTDNSIGFWTIGTGLSYDHSTHTLSSSSNSLYVTPNYNLVDTVIGKSALELSDGTFFMFTPTGSGFVNYSISSDKTKVYKMTIAYTSGSNYNLTLEEYTGNANGAIGTLANTYTGSGSHTVGNNNYSGALFVNGTSVFVPLANGTASTKYTEYTISGASLTSPVITNLDYEPTNSNYLNFYWFHDGTNYFIWNNGGSTGNVRKFSYSAGTFTPVSASSGISSYLSTQSLSSNAGVNILFINYFKILTGKIVNFTSLKTSASTLSTPVWVSGVLLANNVSAP